MEIMSFHFNESIEKPIEFLFTHKNEKGIYETHAGKFNIKTIRQEEGFDLINSTRDLNEAKRWHTLK